MRSSVRVIRAQQRSGDEDRVERKSRGRNGPEKILANTPGRVPLWQLDLVEVTGHNLEMRGREEVNRLLASGWLLLHIYTLKYREDGIWRERPMAILGRLRRPVGKIGGAHEASSADHVSEHAAVGNH
jgi:hypothetical protein